MRKTGFLGMLLIVILLITFIVVPVSAAAPGVAAQEQAAATDPLDIAGMIREAVVLMIFCTGFTSVLKNKFGVSGKWLTASCLVWGMLLGVGYRVAVNPPVNFTGWFMAILFGFLCGLVATGVYDAYGNKIDPDAG